MATGITTSVMNYTNYETNMVIKYKVKLVSWYVKDMEECVAAGEVIGKKWKSRSDKGTKKGARKPANGKDEEEEDSAGEGPSKKQKVLAPKKATKMKERRENGGLQNQESLKSLQAK